MLKRFIPEWLGARIAGRDTVQRVAGNTAWLAADQVLRLAVGFVVTVWVARYLGVSQFGQLNYAFAYCAPFAALVSLSLNGIVVRDLVRERGNAGEILGTSVGLRICGGVLAIVLGTASIWRIDEAELGTRVLVLIVLAGTVLQAGDVLELWFQGDGRAWVGSMARTVSYLSHAAIRIGLVLAGAPLVWFAIVTVTEVVLCTGLWSMAYLRGRGAVAWTFSGARALRMLGFAWPLAMGGVAIQVQAHLDQILLAGFHGADALGIYSAAMRLVAVFGFVPIALHNAAAPEITRAHADDPALYARRLRDVYRMVLVVFLASAIPLSLLSESVILVVFGGSFSAASALVPLLMLRLLLISLATIRNLFITNEELFKHSLITACASLLLNAALNVVLIPRLGATGCVLAAVLSFAMNIGIDAVHKRARFNLRLLLSAIGLAPLPR